MAEVSVLRRLHSGIFAWSHFRTENRIPPPPEFIIGPAFGRTRWRRRAFSWKCSPAEMLADHIEEDLAVLGELHLAHAMDLGHLGWGAGLAPRHVDQALVGEHQVGRNAPVLGELEAAALEGLEQGGIRIHSLRHGGAG